MPDENSQNIITDAKKLKLEGYEVVPHLPARTIKNNSELEKYIANLSEVSGCNKILIIGGGGSQKGDISSSIDVLKTDLLSKYNFIEVGVAGHPEGSPDINDEEIEKAIIEKNKIALKVDYKMYLATQFFFEATSLIEWEINLKNIGNKLDIHAGIPGPASLKTLISLVLPVLLDFLLWKNVTVGNDWPIPTLATWAYSTNAEVPVGTSYTFCSPGETGTASDINLLTGAIAILSQC